MHKLIYFLDFPLTESVQQFYFLDDLAQSGFDLEYWDLSVTHPRGAEAPRAGLARPYVRRPTSKKDLAARVAAAAKNGAIFLPLVNPEPRFLGLFRKLTEHGAPLFTFAFGRLPAPSESFLRRLLSNADYLVSPRKLLRFLGNRVVPLAKRLNLVKKYDVVFAAGEAAINEVAASKAASTTGGALKIVPVNAHYYDDFLARDGTQQRLVEGRYGVFLDDNLPHHPDMKYQGITYIDAEPYYAAVNAFLGRLEEKYGAAFVIAAHPKSDYRTNPFGGRKIFKFQTQALAEHCEFAVTTISTSLGYAVLYRRPIVFVKTDAMIRQYEMLKLGTFQRLTADFLGCPIVGIDDPAQRDAFAFREVDDSRYDAFKSGFIVPSGLEGKRTKDIFKEFVRNY